MWLHLLIKNNYCIFANFLGEVSYGYGDDLIRFTIIIKVAASWLLNFVNFTKLFLFSATQVNRKSSFLFWLLNMSLKFWVAVATSQVYQNPVDQLSLYFLFWTCVSEIDLFHISLVTGQHATQNL